MTQTRSERRKHPRVPVRIRIQYRVADQFFTDYIQNLSLGGIFVETTDPLPVHTALKVQFSLPSLEEPIVADGVVVHRVEISGGKSRAAGGMGIRFSQLDERSKRTLEAYIQKLQTPSKAHAN